MIVGPRVHPRDVDVVIDGASLDAIASAFAPLIERRTRFGGLALRDRDWLFDVWPLADTWAFRQRVIAGSDFSDLPKTTFLNVEAVAIEFIPPTGRERIIVESGFFEGIANRIVEINLEENPFPALCVVRSLITAAKMEFRIGPKLSRYVDDYFARHDLEELVRAQEAHYGRVYCSISRLRSWAEIVASNRRVSRSTPVALPDFADESLPFRFSR
jgi:hypothetical protein